MIPPSHIINVLKEKFKLKGMIMVGSNEFRELWKYRKYKINPLVLFEPIKEHCDNLRRKSDQIIVYNKAVSNFNGFSKFYVASNSVSSSLLKPKHVIEDEKITVLNEIDIEVVKLDDFIINKDNFNLLVIDAEGSEMNILEGAENFIKNNIDVLNVELNYKENYEGLTLAQDVKEYMNHLGFVIVKEKYCNKTKTYSDALFIKN